MKKSSKRRLNEIARSLGKAYDLIQEHKENSEMDERMKEDLTKLEDLLAAAIAIILYDTDII